MKELNRMWNYIFLVGALGKRRYVTRIFLSFALFTGVFWCTFHWCILVHFSLVYSGTLFTGVLDFLPLTLTTQHLFEMILIEEIQIYHSGHTT